MNYYKLTKKTTVCYQAIIQCETEEEANKLMEDVDLDDCYSEESWVDIETELLDGNKYIFPVIKKTENGYEVIG